MTETHSGILKLSKKGAGHLVDPANLKDKIYVPHNLVRQYHLPEGATVAGPVRNGQPDLQLTEVDTVCGLSPEDFQQRPQFKQLVAIDPCEPSLFQSQVRTRHNERIVKE